MRIVYLITIVCLYLLYIYLKEDTVYGYTFCCF